MHAVRSMIFSVFRLILIYMSMYNKYVSFICVLIYIIFITVRFLLFYLPFDTCDNNATDCNILTRGITRESSASYHV